MKPQNITFIRYNIQSRILRGDPITTISSSYWSKIHEISDSIRNDFLIFNEIKTENRTENPIVPMLKKVEFQHDEHEAS